jgi:hypothetical protein
MVAKERGQVEDGRPVKRDFPGGFAEGRALGGEGKPMGREGSICKREGRIDRWCCG